MSILVSMIFIIILSLITTSFALLMRREQRQALDRQLSTQAFYAAETGINDAIKNINVNSSNQDCSTTNTGQPQDLGDGLAYSCVLIDKTPTSLEYSQIETDKSTIIPVQAAQGIQKIKINWESSDGDHNFASSSVAFNLPQESYLTNPANSSYFAYVGGGTGILRASVMPITASLSRTDLTNNVQTMFLYPQAGTGSANQRGYNANQAVQGDIVSGKCNTSNTPRKCSVEITNLPSVTNYYLRLKSIYHASNVSIQAFATNASTTPLALIGTQAKIDSTGRANDVLRRIQVRVPIQNEYMYPEFALETADDICKLITTIPPSTVQDNLCYVD